MSRVQGETVVCIDCHEPFTWSYGEQDFYRKLGHQPPKRCHPCRLAHDNKLRSSQNRPSTLCCTAAI